MNQPILLSTNASTSLHTSYFNLHAYLRGMDVAGL